jgi:hypothetical protein
LLQSHSLCCSALPEVSERTDMAGASAGTLVYGRQSAHGGLDAGERAPAMESAFNNSAAHHDGRNTAFTTDGQQGSGTSSPLDSTGHASHKSDVQLSVVALADVPAGVLRADSALAVPHASAAATDGVGKTQQQASKQPGSELDIADKAGTAGLDCGVAVVTTPRIPAGHHPAAGMMLDQALGVANAASALDLPAITVLGAWDGQERAAHGIAQQTAHAQATSVSDIEPQACKQESMLAAHETGAHGMSTGHASSQQLQEIWSAIAGGETVQPASGLLTAEVRAADDIQTAVPTAAGTLTAVQMPRQSSAMPSQEHALAFSDTYRPGGVPDPTVQQQPGITWSADQGSSARDTDASQAGRGAIASSQLRLSSSATLQQCPDLAEQAAFAARAAAAQRQVPTVHHAWMT